MSSGGADALKAAVRRSLPIIIGLVLLGVLAVNGFERLEGPQYQATAVVEVPNTSLAEIVTGTTSPLLDPQLTQDTAQALAGASQVYQQAASLTRNHYGTAGDIQNATTVNAVDNTDLLSFVSTGNSTSQTIGRANAAAQGFVSYSQSQTNAAISTTVGRLRATLPTLATAQQAAMQQNISRLLLLQSASGTNVYVAQPAITADRTSPKTGKDTAIGFAIGLVIALMLVAVREAVDTTVRTESDIEELLAAPVLASVRTLPRRTQIVTVGRYEPMFGDTYALLAAQLTGDTRENERNILAITSAMPGEGKTTTAANLAIALARRGHAVLIADFDFHKPTLSNLFDVPVGTAGGLQVLEGIETLEDTLWEVPLDGPRPSARWRADPDAMAERRIAEIRALTNGREAQGTLTILPSGAVAGTEPPVNSQRMGALLRELTAYADIVVLDTPPALVTVEMTELAQLIDMVVVVVRQGRVSQRTLRTLGRHARTWPAQLTGAVLTDVPASTSYGAYYGSK